MDRHPTGKFITCILTKGKARELAIALKEKKDIISVSYQHVRGASAMAEKLGFRGLGQTQEKDVLTAVVTPEKADDIFEFIFEEAGIGQAHGGFMFQGNLAGYTPLTLPEIPEDS